MRAPAGARARARAGTWASLLLRALKLLIVKGNQMKKKMWCLIHKETKRVIEIGLNDGSFVVGFGTKKGLVSHLDGLEYDEEVKRITFIT